MKPARASSDRACMVSSSASRIGRMPSTVCRIGSMAATTTAPTLTASGSAGTAVIEVLCQNMAAYSCSVCTVSRPVSSAEGL